MSPKKFGGKIFVIPENDLDPFFIGTYFVSKYNKYSKIVMDTSENCVFGNDALHEMRCVFRDYSKYYKEEKKYFCGPQFKRVFILTKDVEKCLEDMFKVVRKYSRILIPKEINGLAKTSGPLKIHKIKLIPFNHPNVPIYIS